MKRHIIISLLAFLAVFATISAAGQTPDSTLTERALKRMIVENPERVISLLDSAETTDVAALPQYRIDLLRALAYNELHMFSLKNRYARKALESDSMATNPTARLQALIMLAKSEAFYSNYSASIALAEEAIGIARDLGNKPAELDILHAMANNAFDIGDRKAGYRFLHDIIEGNIDSDNVRVLANVSSALGTKIIQLYTDDRFDDALAESDRRLAVIDRIDKIGGAPKGFTDQQRAYTYARIASSAAIAGNNDKADKAYDDFRSTDYGRTTYGKAFITDYLLNAGKYRELLANAAPLYEIMVQYDTINPDYHSLLYCTAKAYAGLGDTRMAYDLAQRAAVINDSIYAREKDSRAQELAIMFQLNEKELMLERSNVKLQKRRVLLTAAAGVTAIILIILVVLLVKYRNILQHNRIAARQIDELLAQKEQLYQSRLQSTDDNSKGHDDYNEFVAMEKLIVEKQLFTRANFNRDSIAEECGLSRNRVVMLIQQYANTTPGDYINKLKILHSVKMINMHPDWTIDAIAEASGYTNRSTYYQNFYKVFGITPAQYRKQADHHQ
ncbi:MAG: helix-turn-helix domain-containing protein [Bacteroidales bacterium]|nr:helix-turn-helix domain-containing protein [Bacteroidales bacterium]